MDVAGDSGRVAVEKPLFVRPLASEADVDVGRVEAESGVVCMDDCLREGGTLGGSLRMSFSSAESWIAD